MSKPCLRFVSIFLLFAVCLQAALNTSAQTFEAVIDIDPVRSIALVEGKLHSDGVEFTDPNLSFTASVAGHRDIAKRIRGVEIFDQQGAPVPFRKLIDSEYLAEGGVFSWRYEVDLAPLKDVNAAAHASWISGEKGILMLADILPIMKSPRGRLKLRVPSGWNIFTTETSSIDDVFDIENAGNAVFAIGRGWQSGRPLEPKSNMGVLVTGERHFTPAEAAEMAQEIFLELKSVFGEEPVGRNQVILSNFPMGSSSGQWQAETRGRNVTIISSDMPFKTQSLQRLHEQLRHELFHLWIPNGVNLTGNYDWFYEGFALYESLKLGVAVNRIRFEDFLDTLSRAHTIDNAGSQRTSLIQMSANRFSGANTQVYARGMLVGFLCDISMLQQSKGKRSAADLLKELFGKHRKPTAPAEGNTAVLALLKSNPNLVPIVEKYIAGSDKLEWASELAGAGIEDTDAGPLTSLRVKEKLNGRQKDLLDKLGYNNWRKLAPTSK